MKTSKYRYSGPSSGVTLQDGETGYEVMLHPGTEVELPEAHEYTRTLLALNYLTPVPEAVRPGKSAARGTAADESTEKGA
ncbi:hypothetical protein [Leeia aquatica]|uniref:Uncharacterized protein n=1 Tax=Leeia aquatica TaxID=2725557 RepID=A0A847RQS0_9NEIS|nr:hypothetical protein [Leeia aquatica]NLR73580.1 hypothetical protein [Leeia aquatica]